MPKERLHYNAPLSTYIKAKLEMIQDDFHIKLYESEIKHMRSLTTEIAVDNYAKKLIRQYL